LELTENSSCLVTIRFAPSSDNIAFGELVVTDMDRMTVGLVPLKGTASTGGGSLPELSRPADGATGLNPDRATLTWKKLYIPGVTYKVYVCEQADFAGCTGAAPNAGQ
jgi:hypothetical protein